MEYNKDSFLAGVAVGRTLKGWASAGSGASEQYPGGYGWDTSNPQTVYRHMRPAGWLPMPTPAEDELWLLMQIPAEGRGYIAFETDTTAKKNADNTTYHPDYTVDVYDVVDGSRTLKEHTSVASGAVWETSLLGSDYHNPVVEDGATYTQALVRVYGPALMRFIWRHHSALNNGSSAWGQYMDWRVVEIAGRLPSVVIFGRQNQGLKYSAPATNATRFFALHGTNKLKYLNFSHSAQQPGYAGGTNLRAVLELDCSSITDGVSFSGCYKLLAVPHLNLENSTVAPNFNTCYALVVAPSFDVPKATTASSLFYNCKSLEKVGNLSFPAAQTIAGLFSGCTSLKRVGRIFAPVATVASTLFTGCTSLEEVADIDLPAVTNMGSMFYNCISIEAAPSISAPAATIATNMFYGCQRLKKLPAITVNATSNNANDIFYMCLDATETEEINVGSAVATRVFANCYGLRKAKITASGGGAVFSGCVNLEDVEITCTGRICTPVSGGKFYQSLRRFIFRTTNTAFGGSALDFSGTSLCRPEVLEMFAEMPDISSGTTRNITLKRTPAAADLTADDIAVAVAKGWSIVT